MSLKYDVYTTDMPQTTYWKPPFYLQKVRGTECNKFVRVEVRIADTLCPSFFLQKMIKSVGSYKHYLSLDGIIHTICAFYVIDN